MTRALLAAALLTSACTHVERAVILSPRVYASEVQRAEGVAFVTSVVSLRATGGGR